MFARTVTLLGIAAILTGCSNYATVSERRPIFRPVRTVVASVVKVQKRIAAAIERQQNEPLLSLGEYLAAAQDAAQDLQANPGDAAALEAYNFALARIVETIKKGKLGNWEEPLRVPAAGGDYFLTHKPDPRPQWNPSLYEFTPADAFDMKGSYVTERIVRPGIGAPLVAVGRETNKAAAENFTPARTYYAVTAVLRFENRQCIVSFEDPLASETTMLGGRRFPLAADFTVPLAVMLAETDPKKAELSRLLDPQKYAKSAQLSRLQPYDPNKTVVLVIHGLQDSGATWSLMINHLRGSETIRRNYQFWYFTYPSGYPYPYSAAILRQQLDAAGKKFPIRKPMVVIGHSMGGCISRLLVTDSGDKLWLKTFGKPPQEVSMSPGTKKLFTESLIFKHRPEIGRVIFISAPLRGSDFASNWIGRIGSSLVKTPPTLFEAGDEARKYVVSEEGDLKLTRIPNSVDTLAPNNKFVKAINQLPMTPGIPYHVISGDRGEGGNKDHTKPVMTDGIVPYWSSHLDGAVSELVVPSPHSAHQNPQAIAEVKRILIKYANQNRRRTHRELPTRGAD